MTELVSDIGANGDVAAPPPVAGSAIFDRIPLRLRVVLGSVSMSVGDVARLGPGALVRLDRTLGQPVDLMIGDRLICRGEIGVTADDPPRFTVRITELESGGPSGGGR